LDDDKKNILKSKLEQLDYNILKELSFSQNKREDFLINN
jgi:hypothetical protein